MSAPYTGGFSPGDSGIFAVDGDFSICDPCSLPEISYPFQGDSILSIRDIMYFAPTPEKYVPIPWGTFPNIQPWSANQAAIVINQDFMVAQQDYKPMHLNTPYNILWANGWYGYFPDGLFAQSLVNCFLVREGELQDMGAGISKLRRTWASIPPTRNEVEQYIYNYIGFEDEATGTTRVRIPVPVQSRIQYDYFIFDDYGVLTLPVFPAGPVLNAITGINPANLILQPQYYFSGEANANVQNLFTEALDDGVGGDGKTIPDFSDYVAALTGSGTSNGLAAEIIAEGSTMTRWMGNIWERRTRFVIAQ
jgi:hypothetical protein